MWAKGRGSRESESPSLPETHLRPYPRSSDPLVRNPGTPSIPRGTTGGGGTPFWTTFLTDLSRSLVRPRPRRRLRDQGVGVSGTSEVWWVGTSREIPGVSVTEPSSVSFSVRPTHPWRTEWGRGRGRDDPPARLDTGRTQIVGRQVGTSLGSGVS